MILFNGKPINVTIFPDNTSQVWKLNQEILETTNFANITWDFEHEGEFMHLAQLKMLLDKYNFKTRLKINYLPYGRQDKMIGNGSTFALETFSYLLNKLHFDEIVILDPHSDVAGQLINNSKSVYPYEEVNKVAKLTDADILCYPDAGAVRKYIDIYKAECIYGEKVRNQSTGNIISYTLFGAPQDQNVLIVDDICDGGMTFKLLTQQLLAAGAKEVNLFVTHGVFSKGLSVLHEAGIKRIFTAKGEATEHQQHITYRTL